MALYARLIGGSWTEVGEPLRLIHAAGMPVRARGQVRIEHGRNPLARIIARILRLPKPDAAAPVLLTISVLGEEEIWHRSFDGRCLDTRQYESSDSSLAERFGVLEFRYRLAPSGGSLLYAQREAAFRLGPLRLRIPARYAPRVEAREDPAGDTRFTVNVRVVLPGVGPLIAYRGTMVVQDGNA